MLRKEACCFLSRDFAGNSAVEARRRLNDQPKREAGKTDEAVKQSGELPSTPDGLTQFPTRRGGTSWPRRHGVK